MPRRLVAALVLAAPLFATPAAGGELWLVPTQIPPPPPDITPLLPPEQRPRPSFMESMGKSVSAVGLTAEHTHDLLERGILAQAIRLDDFFGTVNSKKEQRTSYLLRWRSGLRFEEGGKLKLGSTLRADVQLSRIDERLRLSFSGENEPEPFAPRLPEDPGTPGFDRTFQSARIVNTELRYQLIRSPLTDFFIGAGLDLTFPPQIFLRTRYQHVHKMSEISLVRFAETLFVKSSDGPGETTEFSLERSLSHKTLLRWANTATLSHEVGALEWGSELSLLHELSPKSAVTLLGGIYGNTSGEDIVNNYRLLLRYRRNFLRSWLFYEMEPELSWPRTADDRFPTTYAFTLRLEVVFQGKEEKAPKNP